MHGLAVLLLSTPVFGLALTPPDVAPMVAVAVMDVGGSAPPPAALSASVKTLTLASEVAAESVAGEADQDDYTRQMKKRNALVRIHRPLGISTWVAMTAAVTLGAIQYYNLYGFFAGQGSNPCVEGSAIFGQGQCSGTPWPHAIAAGVTTGLYAATFTVSLMMPDPDDLSSGKGEFAETLRLHKFLRWVHFGGMVLQAVLGVVIANELSGLDRANDYDTLQTLATVHLASGLVTYGALTWAGALMTF